MVRLRTLRPNAAWAWAASIWMGIGLFGATQSVVVMRSEGMHHAWTALFVTQLLSWMPWALATPVVLRLGRRYPPVRLRPLSTWLVHLAASGAMATVTGAWVAWLEGLLNPWTPSAPPEPFVHLWLDRLYNGLLQALFLYAAILAVSCILDSKERLASQRTQAARLDEELSRAQLDALRRQIEPHFLFNTLNAIAALVREGKSDAAVDTIAGLSDCLRRVVEDSGRQEVLLREEVEFLRRYLEIQKLRYAERLQVDFDISAALLTARVPSFVLQPMVENAVTHGIAKRAQGGAIRIAAGRTDGVLTLSVYNDGPQLPPNWEAARSGIAITNVRTRLKGLYGQAAEMRIRNRGPSGVEVSVSVPFKEG